MRLGGQESWKPRKLALAVLLATGIVSCSQKPPPQPQLPDLDCRGNEPFWSLKLGADEARLTRLGEDTVSFRRSSGNDSGQVVWQSSSGGQLNLELQEEKCLDTMSDETPPGTHSIELSFEGTQYRGCCGPRTGEQDPGLDPAALEVAVLSGRDPSGDWSARLMDLLPAITRCTAQSSHGARVSKAWPMNRGMAGVRFRDTVGGYFECVAPVGAGPVDRIQSLDPGTAPLPLEHVVLFVPVGTAPLTGNCYVHERVLDSTGQLLGILSTNTC